MALSVMPPGERRSIFSDRPSCAGGDCAVVEALPRRLPRAFAHAAPAVLAALIPKCPLCWLAYASAFGVAGMAPVAARWAMPVTLGLLALSLLAIVLRRSTGPWPLGLAVLGAAVVVLARSSPWAALGAPLLVAAALWGPASARRAGPDPVS